MIPVIDLTFDKGDNFTSVVYIDEHDTPLHTNKDVCVICVDRVRSHILLNCGHYVCCGVCCWAVSVCPICRVKVENCIKVYT